MVVWKCKPFRDLSVYELYDIMRLRIEVFIVEQKCIFQDADELDQHCYHLCGWDNNRLIAYTRIIPPGITFDEPSIGRVVSSPIYRKTGAGRLVMEKSIEHCIALFGNHPIKIGAQLYLKKFYESLGFVQCSDIYVEDGIEHIEMIYNPLE